MQGTEAAISDQAETLKAAARGVTARAIAIGLSVAVFVNGWSLYSTWVIRSSNLGYGFLSPPMLIALLLVVCVVNPILKWVRPGSGLSIGEMLTIFAMGFVGGAPITGLISSLVKPTYFATPENQWATLLHPHIPSWIAPSDVDGSITLFFKGVPAGRKIPWGVWAVPMLWWVLLFGVLAFSAMCISVILRKQWVENERLRFPILEPVLAMTEGWDSDRMWPAFARGRLFWIGASVAFVYIFWNSLPWISPVFPKLPVKGRLFSFFGRDTPGMFTYIDPFTFSFSYFANLEILFSVWFFFGVFMVEFGTFNRLGFSIGRRGDRAGSYDAASSWQSLGAFCVFVIFGLWMARRHLKDVVMQAWRPDPQKGEDRELVSYRTAVVGVLVGLVFTIVWLNRAGMDYALALPLVWMMLILYIGVARIIAEAGLLYVSGPMTAQTFSVYLLGAKSVSPSSLVALQFSYLTNSGVSSLGRMAHITKASESIRESGRRLFGAVALAFLVTTCVMTFLTLYVGYTLGAENCSGWTVHTILDTVSKIKDPFVTDWNRIRFFWIGAAIMAVLMLLRYRLPWWPLHPVGFTIMATDLVRNFALTLFLAWACKWLILQVGGITLYRRAQPLFLGLLVGHVLGIAAAFLVDMFLFPGAGHMIHPWIQT